MTMFARSARDDGFTLIETIVAFSVLALALMILSQSILQATTQIRTADTAGSARVLAAQLLATAQTNTSQTSATGVDAPSGLAWTWSKKLMPRADQQSRLPAAMVTTVKVSKPEQAAPLLVLRSIGYAEVGS